MMVDISKLPYHFQCYEVLKQNDGERMNCVQVSEALGNMQYKRTEAALMLLAQDYPNIHVSDFGGNKVYWWESKLYSQC